MSEPTFEVTLQVGDKTGTVVVGGDQSPVEKFRQLGFTDEDVATAAAHYRLAAKPPPAPPPQQ